MNEEMSRYQTLPPVNSEDDPLLWWKDEALCLPILAGLENISVPVGPVLDRNTYSVKLVIELVIYKLNCPQTLLTNLYFWLEICYENLYFTYFSLSCFLLVEFCKCCLNMQIRISQFSQLLHEICLAIIIQDISIIPQH